MARLGEYRCPLLWRLRICQRHDTTAQPGAWHDQPASLVLDLPPLATLVLRLDNANAS